MKHLKIESKQYQELLNSFKKWLAIKGKSSGVVKCYPNDLTEFFYYMETVHHIMDVKKIEQKHSELYKRYLQTRKAFTKNTGLSNSRINSLIKSKNSFIDFLAEATPLRMQYDRKLRYLKVDEIENEVLTRDEIKELYEATYEPYSYYVNSSQELGQRDRVIIGLLYGCGLRNTEASKLDLEDVDLENRKILVRFGKGNKQRYVPIPNQTVEDLKDYIQNGRYYFICSHKKPLELSKRVIKPRSSIDERALLLNDTGQRYKYLFNRINKMIVKTSITKHVTPHKLRHSLGTHLYQCGMPLNDIKLILGHSSVDITQIYVRITKKMEEGLQEVL